jgi:hypothetical protein
MTFKQYLDSLTFEQAQKVRKAITPGYLVHLISGRRLVGAHTYAKLKKIDPKLTWETLRG